MSKIQAELAKATGVNPEQGQSIIDPAYMKKLVRAVANLSDKDWDALSGPAQEHHNAAADAANAKKDIPNFPDYVEPEEAAPRRRRAAAEDDAPAAKAYKPAKGDEVEIVTSRDKVVVGKVVDPDDAGDLVLLVDGEEIGYGLAKLKSITQKNAPEPEADKPRHRRAAEDDDEPAVVEPEVGDTVEVENSRGAKKMGNIIEMDGEVLVIKDAAGEEIEYAREKVKSIVVKVKNAKPASARGRVKAGDDDKGDTKKDDKPARVGKEANGGVSVTTRLRELMCETPLDPLSLEDLGKAIKKEGLTCNDSTMKMVHADCVKLFKMLAAGKHLK